MRERQGIIVRAGAALTIIVATLLDLTMVINSQAAGERLVYLAVGQSIETRISGMNQSPRPSRISIGAWYKPTCTNRASILSDREKSKTTFSGMYSPLWYSEEEFDDSKKRTIQCGSWFAVALMFNPDDISGWYTGDLNRVYAIGPFEDISSNVEKKITYKTYKSQNKWYLYLDVPSGVTIYNPFYYISYNSNKGVATGEIGASLFEIFVGTVNPNLLQQINFYKYFTQPVVWEGDTSVSPTVETQQSTTPLLYTTDMILPRVTNKGFLLQFSDKYFVFDQVFSLPDTDSAGGFKQRCVDIQVFFDLGDLDSARGTQEVVISLQQAGVAIFADIEYEVNYSGDSKVRFRSGGSTHQTDNRATADFTDASNSINSILEIRFCAFSTHLVGHFILHSGTMQQLLKSDLGFSVPRGSSTFNAALPIDLKVSFTNTNTSNNNFYLTRIRIHEGGIYTQKSTFSPTQQNSSALCLQTSFVQQTTAPQLVNYCLVCPFLSVNVNGVCTMFTSVTPTNSTVSFESLTKQWECDSSTFYYNKVGYFCYPILDSCAAPLINETPDNYCSTPLADACGPFQNPNAPCTCIVPNCQTCTKSLCEQCNPTFYLKISGATVSCENPIPAGYGVIADATANPVVPLTIRPCAKFGCTDCAADYKVCSTTTVVCGPNCATCQPNDPTACMSCLSGFTLFDDATCSTCSTNCQTCAGLAVTCTSCGSGQFMTVTNTCSPCNSPGVYRDYSNSSLPRCSACMTQCQTCTQAASCTSCKPGLYIYKTNFTCSTCLGSTEAIEGVNCVLCDSTCLTCSGSKDTDCLTCVFERYLSSDKRCVERKMLVLTDQIFSNELQEAVFTFDRSPIPEKGVSLKENTEIAIFLNKLEIVEAALQSATGELKATAGLQYFADFSVPDILISGQQLRVKTAITKSIKDGTLVVRFKKLPGLVQAANANNYFPKNILTLGKIDLVVTGFDGALNAASSSVKSSVTTATSAMFLISLPQAFILMKVFQTVDFYIFIDCEYPPNFSKFLDMISQNVMDYLPNMYEGLADDAGTPLYRRFSEFGQEVHIFKNLGQHFTLYTIVLGLKLLVFALSKIFPKVKKIRKLNAAIGSEVFFGLVEAFHLDIVLAVIIHIGFRDQVDNKSSGLKYFAIVAVSLISMGLISIYLFMGYTVSRLTTSLGTFALLQAKDLKDEPCRFWLEDKVDSPNRFQRHFNLILMLKDVYVCVLLLALYSRVTTMLSLLLIQQVIFFAFAWAYPPYRVGWNNTVMLITQCLYIFLDIAFLVNVTAKINEETRYFYIGFSMIAIVLCIILVNICIGTFFQGRELWRSCVKKMKKAQTAPKTTLAVHPQPSEKNSLSHKKEDFDESAGPVVQEEVSIKLPNDKIPSESVNLAQKGILIDKTDKPKKSGGPPGIVLKRKPQIKHRSKPPVQAPQTKLDQQNP